MLLSGTSLCIPWIGCGGKVFAVIVSCPPVHEALIAFSDTTAAALAAFKPGVSSFTDFRVCEVSFDRILVRAPALSPPIPKTSIFSIVRLRNSSAVEIPVKRRV